MNVVTFSDCSIVGNDEMVSLIKKKCFSQSNLCCSTDNKSGTRSVCKHFAVSLVCKKKKNPREAAKVSLLLKKHRNFCQKHCSKMESLSVRMRR